MSELVREVVYRDAAYTEMRVNTEGGAKAFAKQLIRDGKAFSCMPGDTGWEFTVYEVNHPGKYEYA